MFHLSCSQKQLLLTWFQPSAEYLLSTNRIQNSAFTLFYRHSTLQIFMWKSMKSNPRHLWQHVLSDPHLPSAGGRSILKPWQTASRDNFISISLTLPQGFLKYWLQGGQGVSCSGKVLPLPTVHCMYYHVNIYIYNAIQRDKAENAIKSSDFFSSQVSGTTES